MNTENILNWMDRHGVAIFGGVMVALGEIFMLITPSGGAGNVSLVGDQTVTWSMLQETHASAADYLWLFLGIVMTLGIMAILYSAARRSSEVNVSDTA